MTEKRYYLPGNGEDEIRSIGHRIVFNAQGISTNIGGIVVDPKILVPAKEVSPIKGE